MKAILIVALCGFSIALAACSGTDGGQQRGLFTGAVTDKTEEEVSGKFGKPDAVDSGNPSTLKWVYKRKTFDPDNQNQVDNETILIFQKDASGKFKVKQVVFG